MTAMYFRATLILFRLLGPFVRKAISRLTQDYNQRKLLIFKSSFDSKLASDILRTVSREVEEALEESSGEHHSEVKMCSYKPLYCIMQA